MSIEKGEDPVGGQVTENEVTQKLHLPCCHVETQHSAFRERLLPRRNQVPEQQTHQISLPLTHLPRDCRSLKLEQLTATPPRSAHTPHTRKQVRVYVIQIPSASRPRESEVPLSRAGGERSRQSQRHYGCRRQR